MVVENSNPTNPVDGQTNQNTSTPRPVDGEGNTPPEDYVKFTSYKKAVDESKAYKSKHADAIAELAKYQAKEKADKEQRLIEDRKFDEYMAKKEEETKTLREELNETRKDNEDYRKMTSFLSAMGSSKVESKYYSLIPLDSIELDESGAINQESLNEAVNNFKAEHSRLIISPKTGLPSNKVGGSTTPGLSYEEWSRLGSAKEMRERAKEVDFSKVGK
jgi:vacuolar-type H+-ATPase subunit I/STV1